MLRELYMIENTAQNDYREARKKATFYGVVSLALVFLLLAPQSLLAGFGVSPPQVAADRLVPGSHFESVIFLVQGNPEEDVLVNVAVDSKDIKEWISFDPGTQFTIPAGVQQFPLTVIIDVPSDVDLGAYNAFVRVQTDPKEAREAGEVAVSVGGRIDVNVTVGDEVVETFEVRRIQLLDIKEGKPLAASVTVNNTGNVPTTPDTISYELFNKFGEIRLAFVETSDFEKVPSFTEETIDVSFPIDIVIAPGEYWGHVKVYDEEGDLKGELRTVFNVHERTLLDTVLIPGGIGVLALLVLLILLRFIFRKRSARAAAK